MNELVGKSIRSIYVSDDQRTLSFETDQGTITYDAKGDCCSESWFADITGVSALLGGTVTTAQEISMDGYNVNDGRCRQEKDAAYGVKITTNKGYADIVYRNSSNGYYGGWIGLSSFIPKDMTEITDDWSA